MPIRHTKKRPHYILHVMGVNYFISLAAKLRYNPLQSVIVVFIGGGEGGIRTHGPLRSHWFSRPAP